MSSRDVVPNSVHVLSPESKFSSESEKTNDKSVQMVPVSQVDELEKRNSLLEYQLKVANTKISKLENRLADILALR